MSEAKPSEVLQIVEDEVASFVHSMMDRPLGLGEEVIERCAALSIMLIREAAVMEAMICRRRGGNPKDWLKNSVAMAQFEFERFYGETLPREDRAE
jgi:hypothetical protein